MYKIKNETGVILDWSSRALEHAYMAVFVIYGVKKTSLLIAEGVLLQYNVTSLPSLLMKICQPTHGQY